ncbi:MAG: hypothetical protein DRG71_03525, partial [Deltaproteobacteria bacterium]
FITFFASHRRFWIRIESRGGKSKISVAAMASKNPVGLERETHELLETLKTPFGDKKND